MNKEMIMGRLKKYVKSKYFPFALAAVLILILSFGRTGTKKTETGEPISLSQSFDEDKFGKDLEDILSEIRGVRSASVLLSYDGGMKYIYAEDVSETESDGRKSLTRDTVVAGGEAVVVGSNNPKIIGAVVVYTGTRSSAVVLDLTSAVESATGLSSDKITVLFGG